jgi:signal transduction histidine kinase
MDKYIKTIYNKSSDLDSLIDELFLFSKLDLNKLPFNFEKIDLCAYLEDCMDDLRFDLEKKNISLNFNDKCKKTYKVSADREKLKRVITNIIGNSVKYMDKELGQINVNLKHSDEYVIIEIRDNGKGISKDSLSFVFDRFYRADPSRNRTTGGSGLGLSIAKKIIEDHGGTIWAKSEENIGTSIFFTLKKVINLKY